jgi:hypothetical protein
MYSFLHAQMGLWQIWQRISEPQSDILLGHAESSDVKSTESSSEKYSTPFSHAQTPKMFKY